MISRSNEENDQREKRWKGKKLASDGKVRSLRARTKRTTTRLAKKEILSTNAFMITSAEKYSSSTSYNAK